MLSVPPSLRSKREFCTSLLRERFCFSNVSRSVCSHFTVERHPSYAILGCLGEGGPLRMNISFKGVYSVSVTRSDGHSGHSVVQMIGFLCALTPRCVRRLTIGFHRCFRPVGGGIVFLCCSQTNGACESIGESRVSRLGGTVRFGRGKLQAK